MRREELIKYESDPRMIRPCAASRAATRSPQGWRLTKTTMSLFDASEVKEACQDARRSFRSASRSISADGNRQTAISEHCAAQLRCSPTVGKVSLEVYYDLGSRLFTIVHPLVCSLMCVTVPGGNEMGLISEGKMSQPANLYQQWKSASTFLASVSATERRAFYPFALSSPSIDAKQHSEQQRQDRKQDLGLVVVSCTDSHLKARRIGLGAPLPSAT